MRILQDDSAGYAEEFSSWGEWIDTIKERTDNVSKTRRAAIVRKYGNDMAFWCATESRARFTETRDLGEALRIAIDGWSEGLDRARKLANPLFEKVSHLIERVEPVYDIEGGALDIGRYHDGDPEMFMRFNTVVAESAGNRVLRICVNTAVSGAVNTDTIMTKGATISSLVELLELAGNRVELTLIPHAVNNNSVFKSWQRVIVKQAEQPLDLGRVTFALAHPSAVRRLAFSWMDTIPGEDRFGCMCSGHGTPCEIDNTQDYDVYIGRSLYPEPQWTNPESATAWILQSLKEQGVSLKEES